MTKVSALLGLVALLASAPARPAAADEELTPALTTDRKDYSPGEIVTISGFNFVPGEIVTIAVQGPSRPDRFVESVADASGSFTNTDFSPDQGDVQDFLKVVATGNASGPDRAAVAYFYDSTATGGCPYIVDGSLPVSIPASSTFKTIQEAVTALPNPGPCQINIKTGTYREAVLLDGVNSAATLGTAEIVIQPDPSNADPVIVTAPGLPTDATTSYAISLQKSKFVTITGLTMSGSARSAVRLRGDLSPRNADITLDGNIVTGNVASSASVGAIDVGASQTRIWLVNNLILNSGRMGIDVASPNGPIYIVNNTIAANAAGGVNAGGAAVVNLVNNLFVGNGTADPGTAGSCSCGLQGGTSATSITLRNNMFYRNGNPQGGFADVKPAGSILDSTDSNNYFTCRGAGAGCTPTTLGGVAPVCTFTDCASTHARAGEIFASGTDFHLAAGSPAIDKGANSFENPAGTEWVPAIDFDNEPRPQDGDGDGVATTDIGYSETASAMKATTTSVVSSAPGNTSSYGSSVTFTATVAISGSPATGGTVSFYDGSSCGGSQIGSAQGLDASGVATVNTSSLTVGSHTITACYSGGTGFGPSSGTVFLTVQLASQTIAVSPAAPLTAAANASFFVGATASSGLQVEITTTGSCSGNGTGTATISMTSGTGTCVVHYNQAGNTAYAAAAEVTNATTAQKLAQTIAVKTPAPPTAFFNTSFPVSAEATSGLPVVVATKGVCSGGGTVTASILMTSGTGDCVVHFTQPGDNIYAAAPEVTQSTVAQKAPQLITVDPHAPPSAVFNTSFPVGATATAGIGATATSGLPVDITATGVCSGSGTSSVSILMTSGIGTCVVQYTRAANDNYEAATATDSVAALKMSQTINFAALGGKSYNDKPFQVVATATSTLPVVFTSQTPGTCSVAGNTVTILHSGTCTLVASQPGNDNYSAAPDVTQPFSINMGPSTLWLGLKNSDDQGTQFDVRIEVYNARTATPQTLVAWGETYCITGVTRNQQAAKKVTVPMTGFGDAVYVKILTRIGSNPDGSKCSGHASATGLRLYFDSTSQMSQIGDGPLYLHAGTSPDRMNTTAPTTATAAYEDSASIKTAGGNPWVVVGSGWAQ
jgi:hypothetical protein